MYYGLDLVVAFHLVTTSYRFIFISIVSYEKLAIKYFIAKRKLSCTVVNVTGSRYMGVYILQ